MKNRYFCATIVNVSWIVLIALSIITPNLILAQQAPSIQSGVTFQWEDTQSSLSDPATIQSVTVNGTMYNTFVVPTSYEMTTLGPDGDYRNGIQLNGSDLGVNSSFASWNTDAISAFQDKNLNHYFTSNFNGRNICSNFGAIQSTDAQRQTIFYSPSIPANEGSVLAVTERGGNNCFYIEIWGTPNGGGPEQVLGSTFVRNAGNYQNCNFGSPYNNSDYWQSGRCNENGQTIGIALFYLNDIAPIGSKITKIEFVAATRDHGDGKFFILQKYAIDSHDVNCINSTYSGDIDLGNNVPAGSTYQLVSGPTPAGQSFQLNSDGTYTYVPNDGFTGDVTFDYSVCLPAPNTSVCDEATVTLTYVNKPTEPEVEIGCDPTNGNFLIEVINPVGDEFEYSLNNGPFQSSPIFSRSSGTYTLRVRSSYTQCENINLDPIVLTGMNLTATVTDVLCKLENTGAIDITVTGGTPPYSYEWNNTATSEDISNVFGGTYNVIVTDANGCTISDSYTINQPSQELVTSLSTSNVSCYGESDGSIDLTVSGGTAPYTYNWNTGATSQDLNNLAPGSYGVTVTDANGCTSTSQVSISQPSSILTANIISIENIDCNDDTSGSISVEGVGGTSPYSYSINGGTSYQTSGLFENLAAGNYTITVLDSNACSTTIDAQITEAEALQISIEDYNDVSCYGESDANIYTYVEGGTPPYTFSWNNGATSQDITNIAQGNYSVTVTDANGCTATISQNISSPSSALSSNINITHATTSQGCNNGQATINVSGGTAPYTYLWSNSADSQTSATVTNLSNGNHSVTITDANNCQIIETIVIECNDTCDTQVTIDNTNNVSCYGEATGSATVSAASAYNPSATYTFTWSTGQVDSGVTSSTLNNLPSGDYDVSVTMDGTVCSSVQKSFTITQPDSPLSISTLVTDLLGPLTNDGIILATVSGGTPPYSYLWSPGGETTPSILGLSVGSYTVTVTDANGCTLSKSASVDSGTCHDLSISGTSTPVVCNGESNGTATAIVSNGTGPFTYTWDSLTDTTPSVSGLPAGDYTVTVTDETTLCEESTTITISEPDTLSASTNPSHVLCKGDSTGSIDLTVSGGTQPYTYSWNNGATSKDINNLSAGTYSVTITDANGCITTAQNTISEPSENLSASVTQTVNVDCSGNDTGSFIIEASGGVSPYSYSIDNGITSQSDGIFDNLSASNYTVLVTDSNNCSFSLDITISADDTENPEISVPSTITIEGCSTSDITESNALFTYSSVESADVQSIFQSNSDYNASDDFSIENITYIDVITSTDNCPIILTRTFTITDSCNNTASAVQTITIEDTIAPIINIPSDITIECTDDSSSNNTGQATGNDHCSTVTITQIDNETPGTCGNTKTIVRIWTATDECGNTTSADQVITVEDTTPPILTLPEDITLECGDDTSSDNTGLAKGEDSCGGVTISEFDNITNTCGNTQVIERTWTVSDNCGNVTTGVQTITVVDTVAPVLTVPADVTIECTEDTSPANTGQATATDDCATPTISYSDVETAACGNTKTIIRTWTTTDACGNTTSSDQTITTEDTTPPTFSVPANVTLECDQDVNDLVFTGDVTDESDNCSSSNLEATFTDTIVDGACAGSFTINRAWSLSDDCGNTTSLVQTITVQDTTAPTFNESLPADITVECEDLLDAENLTATDNCGDATVTLTETINSGSCDNDYTLIRTWVAQDACGNETSHTQTITVQDTTAPIIDASNIENIDIECGVTPDGTLETWIANNAGATASDSCGNVTWSNDYNDSTSVGCANGAITVTFTAIDDCGNSDSVTATYSIVDTVAPVLTVPADVTIECTEDTSPANTGQATATDDCASPSISYSDVETAACGNTKTIIRTWTATDACGNTTSANQTITTEDTTPPTFSVPANLTLECDQDVNDLVFTGDVTDENDNCSSNLEATFTDTIVDGACAGSFTINRAWSLSDDCGNTTALVQTITVQDTTAPEISVPADVTIECTEDSSSNATGSATGTDNCGDVTISQSDVETAACGNTKTIVRTWTATDACGNTASADQTITVIDTTAPIIDASNISNIDIECGVTPDGTLETWIANNAGATASDSCGNVIWSNDYNNSTTVDCANGAITVTFTATDVCGNSDSVTATYSIVDTVAPVLTVPADVTIECTEDTSPANTGQATATDDCATPTISYSDVETAACGNTKTIIRTWTATDACGNTTSANQTITTEDTTPPTFSVPANLTLECDQDVNDLVFTGDVTDESDNCSSSNLEATFTDTIVDGACAGSFTINRAWSLFDDCGNTTALVQTITVQDTTAPTFNESLPADITVECEDLLNAENLTATDNCGDATVTLTETINSGSCDNDYTLIRTWVAQDACGNETSHTQNITVQDTTAPTFNENLPTDIIVECDNVPAAANLTATDSCGSATVNFSENIDNSNSSCIGEYIIERIWIASDSCGNELIHIQIITVQDTTPPAMVSTFDSDITVSCDEIPNVPSLVFQDSCSNNIDVDYNETSTQTNDFEDYSITRMWTVTDDCGNQSEFVQNITVEISNVIQAENAQRCVLDIEFDLFNLLSGDFDMNGAWTVVSGNATLNGSYFDPNSVDVGDYIFRYSITEGPCPTEVEVTVSVDDECLVLPCSSADNVVISKTVTANGDNFNDFFTVSAIEECGFEIEVQIFNRWGAEVYKSGNYQNDWGGESHSSSVGNSGKVPTGTYYYIINIKNSGLAPFTGPIYVATN
ncbi:gliding motility-associated C-terminal domain-containing protein [Winogradskyella sp. SYSU M77433]|uniref:HYR-like domain-containing protein n=1 Tax=Winogradskyella sp. SYSU M77433 TaxID=3042722 RepID=UPI002481018B|nr:gliding motility-associated C-terminal domain-containing protein [Winogradskyella sp. SYSU M77433]MDH7912674.1 gliding motility-associated C-terminal domain-containing protein [Winogradskyella sp. SYSU M77433]